MEIATIHGKITIPKVYKFYPSEAFEIRHLIESLNHGEFGTIYLDYGKSLHNDEDATVIIDRDFNSRILLTADKEIELKGPLLVNKNPDLGNPFSYEKVIKKLGRRKLFSTNETLAILRYALPLWQKDQVLDMSQSDMSTIRNIFPTITKSGEIFAVSVSWNPYNISHFYLTAYGRKEGLSGMIAGTTIFSKL